MDQIDLSVVIPWRDSGDEYRRKIFNWIKERYELGLPSFNIELVLCDSGDQPFSRGDSRNHGVEHASNELILLGDADTIPFDNWLFDGVRLLQVGAPWVIPYGRSGYYNINKEDSQWVLQQDPKSVEIFPNELGFEHRLLSWAGQILLSKESFMAVGGYDTRFTGWGYEDNAFKDALDVIVGEHERVEDGVTGHIWHPAPVESTWAQPFIRENRQLYERYQNAKSVKEMKEVLELG